MADNMEMMEEMEMLEELDTLDSEELSPEDVEVIETGNGVIKGVALTALGIGIAGGVAFGVKKIYDRLKAKKNQASKEDAAKDQADQESETAKSDVNNTTKQPTKKQKIGK